VMVTSPINAKLTRLSIPVSKFQRVGGCFRIQNPNHNLYSFTIS
jgi:hypothetical protein